MGLLKRIRAYREQRLLKKFATKELDRLDTMEQTAQPISPVLPNEGTSTEMGEVTGTYRTVSAMMKEVIAEKRKGRRAAQRISDSVGVVPVAAKK